MIAPTPIVHVAALIAQAVAATQQLPVPAKPPLPPIQPVVGIDALRTDGPVARYSVELLEGQTVERAPASVGDVFLMSFQAVLGPARISGKLAEAANWLDDYSFRARFTLLSSSERSALGGPMTYAVQRYHRFDALSVNRLLNLQVGIEAAFSTPWLSGRNQQPPGAIQVLHAADTELAQNGWSIRPSTGYFRFDFLACRSLSLEFGGGPEFFAPSQVGTHSEYGLRFRGRFGASVACAHSARSALHPLAIAVQYDGRTRLPSRDDAIAYHQLATLSVQYHFDRVLAHLFWSTPTDAHGIRYSTLGLQVQVGFFGL